MKKEFEFYHDTRLGYDPKRRVVWESLVKYYFGKFINRNATVIDYGCGYCDFINAIEANSKMAIDVWPGIANYANSNVKVLVGDHAVLNGINESSVDLIFASNVFEHMTQSDFQSALCSFFRVLKPTGRLILLQPNFKYCATEYFDDYTHIAIWSHISIKDFLQANNFNIEICMPKFLPLTIKSRLPTWSWMIALYLKLPFKLFGKQMMLVCFPRK